MHKKIWLTSLVAASFPSSVLAIDAPLCIPDTVCAADPMSVVAALQEEGFRAKLDKDERGNPMIISEASGYNFEILFYDCNDHKGCRSLQFQSRFTANDYQTSDYANLWNGMRRFIKAFVSDDRKLFLQYDITTIGGVNKRNFADALSWWAGELSQFSKFSNEQAAARKTKDITP